MKTQHETKPSPSPKTAEENSEEAAAIAPASSTPSPVPQKIWDDLHENLTQALGRWEHLSQEADHKVSPEEKQLQEVKRLLDELKNKLREFSR
jgi:hypothetical protein